MITFDPSLIGAVVGLSSVIVTVIGGVFWLGYRLSTLQVKVDTMWDFMMRRAQSEAIARGWAIMNSPLVVNEGAKEMVRGMIGPIREFYAALGRRQITDNELALEIERRFGDTILEHICIPYGMHLGACLLIIIAELKGNVASAG